MPQDDASDGGRELTVILPLNRDEVEPTRRLMAVQARAARIFRNDAVAIPELLSKPEASPEDGARLGQLAEGPKADAERAEAGRLTLAPILARAWISDPDGRGRLQ